MSSGLMFTGASCLAQTSGKPGIAVTILLGIALVMIIGIPTYFAATYQPPVCLKYEKRTKHIESNCTNFNLGTGLLGGFFFGKTGFLAGGLVGSGCNPARDDVYDVCVQWEEKHD